MMSAVEKLDSNVEQWLSSVVGGQFAASRHAHAHQDAVYKIETSSDGYYLKVAKTLEAERDNLNKIREILQVPKVIDFYETDEYDCLLISELPGKNLVELITERPKLDIVDAFAKAIKQLHKVEITKLFPNASSTDVLLHGDMALPNIIILKQGQIGYLDFGQMSFGPPELDLADAIWSLQRNIGPEYGEIFLEKYGPVVITPKIEKALKFRYKGIVQ